MGFPSVWYPEITPLLPGELEHVPFPCRHPILMTRMKGDQDPTGMQGPSQSQVEGRDFFPCPGYTSPGDASSPHIWLMNPQICSSARVWRRTRMGFSIPRVDVKEPDPGCPLSPVGSFPWAMRERRRMGSGCPPAGLLLLLQGES